MDQLARLQPLKLKEKVFLLSAKIEAWFERREKALFVSIAVIQLTSHTNSLNRKSMSCLGLVHEDFFLPYNVYDDIAIV